MIIDKLGDDEALKVAMNLEEEGIRFYTAAAEAAAGEEIRSLFNHLAEEEKKHYNIFKELHDKRLQDKPDSSSALDDDKIKDYLAQIIRPDVFSGLKSKAANPLEAVEVGILVEKKSIEFYNQAHDKETSQAGKDAYRLIIDEEKKHERALEEEKNKLNRS